MVVMTVLLTVTTTVAPVAAQDGNFPFRDVKAGAWYEQSVQKVWKAGLMNGMTPERFEPAINMSRAMFATVLWRMSGRPEAGNSGIAFSDLSADWYRSAVGWASENGIVFGYVDGGFHPDAMISRAEASLMIWRYMKQVDVSPESGENGDPGKNTSEVSPDDTEQTPEITEQTPETGNGNLTPQGDIVTPELASDEPATENPPFLFIQKDAQEPVNAGKNTLETAERMEPDNEPGSVSFTDEALIPAWAIESVRACRSANLIQGYEDGSFRAANPVSRAEAAKILALLSEWKESAGEKPTVNPDPDRAGDTSAFTDELMRRIAEEPDANHLISPMSLRVALAMTANGAKGDTRDEMLKALHIDDLDAFNRSFQEMTRRYDTGKNVITVDLNQSLWVNADRAFGFSFRDSFLNKVGNYYAAEAQTVKDEDAVKRVNDWISEKTRGKIEQCLDSSDFSMALVNTLYFKGRWETEFSEEQTEKDFFTQSDGSQKTADFMNGKFTLPYYAGNGIQMVELPYSQMNYKEGQGGFGFPYEYAPDMDLGMYLILSDQPVDAAALIDQVDMRSRDVILHIPKFHFKDNHALVETLKDMGMQKAFDQTPGAMGADFSEMSELDQYISSVIQNAYIEVDEHGTEAAAATIVTMDTKTAVPEKYPVEFRADRPFRFVIRDNTSGDVLFCGDYNVVAE